MAEQFGYNTGVKIGKWLMKFRIFMFISGMVLLRRRGINLSKHNIHVIWRLSDKNPPVERELLDLTDEEWDKFEEAIKSM